MKPSQAMRTLALLSLPVLISPKDTSGVGIVRRFCLGGRGRAHSPFFPRSHPRIAVNHRSSNDLSDNVKHPHTLRKDLFPKRGFDSARNPSLRDVTDEAPAHSRRLVGGGSNSSATNNKSTSSPDTTRNIRNKKRRISKIGTAVSKLGSNMVNVGIGLFAIQFDETWLTVFGIGRLVQGHSKLVGNGLSNLGVGFFVMNQVVVNAQPFTTLIGLGQAAMGVGQLIEALQLQQQHQGRSRR